MEVVLIPVLQKVMFVVLQLFAEYQLFVVIVHLIIFVSCLNSRQNYIKTMTIVVMAFPI